MKPSPEKLALVVLSLVLLTNVTFLWPETGISRIDLNDNVFHYALIDRIVQAVQAGENPLDCWSPEWSFGFPVLRTYQPLAHLLVAGVYFALGKTVALMTVFVWVRFLSLALLPLSFFAAARLLRLPPLTAAAAAILAPMISTNYLFGIEYGSFTWAGTGLFSQAVATHFLLLAIGFGYRAICEGRRLALAGLLVGLTFLSHLIYGYVAALSLVLLAAAPYPGITRGARTVRTLAVGGAAFAVAAFQLIPLLIDGRLINHSRWEPVWKWDSFGATAVLTKVFTGELLDYGRLPVLSVLAACGVALLFWNSRQGRRSAPHTFIALGAALWVLMYFGRPFWGSLLSLLGVSEDMHLHRVIGGAHLFLVLLAAIALGKIQEELSRRWHYAAAIAVTALLLYPMARERGQQLANNAAWGRRNLAAHAQERQPIDAALASAKARGGRAYAGLEANWGGRFKVGDVPFYALFSGPHIPAVSYLYHSMALTGDIMVRFNDQLAAQYRLFNIRTVVAPVNQFAAPPGVLTAREQFGRFQTFEAPGEGYIDLVDAAASVLTTRRNFYDVNDRWMNSDWPAKGAHLLLDWHGSMPSGVRRAPEDLALPFMVSPAPNPAGAKVEQQQGETYAADIEVLRPAFAVFKMTWHPNWHAYVDGNRQPAVMLSPGFPGVQMPVGRHRVEFRYEPGPLKPILAIAGLLLLGLAAAGKFRPAVDRVLAVWSGRFADRWTRQAPRLARGGGLIALALPVCIPLFTSGVVWGHHAFGYFPRLIEVHQNLVNGIVLPRWAPDLGHGYGQPLFIFHPPMFYWVAEVWHLLGLDVVTAVNLAAAVVVVAAAFAMFLLGRLYYGETGGWLAAAAYLYAPYFAVNLFVRWALEELTAFPLFALALYGFGAFARGGRRLHWMLGAVAYAAALCCHFPGGLLFTPVLMAFLAVTAWMERSWRVLAAQAAGLMAGLALSAWAWLPALAEKQYVAMDRVTGAIHYTSHFVQFYQFLFTSWGYGHSVKGTDDGMSFAMGWSHVLLIVAACVWSARHPGKGHGRLMRLFAVTAVALCALMLKESVWLWDRVPLLPYVQFPWRLLGPAALCGAMLAAALGPALDSLEKRRGLALAGALALLIVPNLSHLRGPRTVDVDLAQWGPRELSIKGFETTTTGEVTPRWTTSQQRYDAAAATVSVGRASIRDLARTPFSWSGAVIADTDSRVRVSFTYYPGWTVRLDGRLVEASPAPGSGLVEFAVPAGAHEVDVSFGRSTARGVGEGISLLALLVLGALARWQTVVQARRQAA
jgi:uncharacterized membrane protein